MPPPAGRAGRGRGRGAPRGRASGGVPRPLGGGRRGPRPGAWAAGRRAGARGRAARWRRCQREAHACGAGLYIGLAPAPAESRAAGRAVRRCGAGGGVREGRKPAPAAAPIPAGGRGTRREGREPGGWGLAPRAASWRELCQGGSRARRERGAAPECRAAESSRGSPGLRPQPPWGSSPAGGWVSGSPGPRAAVPRL